MSHNVLHFKHLVTSIFQFSRMLVLWLILFGRTLTSRSVCNESFLQSVIGPLSIYFKCFDCKAKLNLFLFSAFRWITSTQASFLSSIILKFVED